MLSTTAVWVTTAYLTAPTDRETLVRFYQLARPAGPGWAAVGAAPAARGGGVLNEAFLGWVAGCAFVYSALFGTGHFLLQHTTAAAVSLVVCVLSGAVLWRVVPRLWAAKS